MEGRLIWKQSRPSFSLTEPEVGNQTRSFYENDPVFNVLLKITIDRHGRPVPHVASDGRKLAVAILAAKAQCSASSPCIDTMSSLFQVERSVVRCKSYGFGSNTIYSAHLSAAISSRRSSKFERSGSG